MEIWTSHPHYPIPFPDSSGSDFWSADAFCEFSEFLRDHIFLKRIDEKTLSNVRYKFPDAVLQGSWLVAVD